MIFVSQSGSLNGRLGRATGDSKHSSSSFSAESKAASAGSTDDSSRIMNGVLWRVVRVRFREGGAKGWTEKFSFRFDTLLKFDSCLMN